VEEPHKLAKRLAVVGAPVTVSTPFENSSARQVEGAGGGGGDVEEEVDPERVC